MRVPSALLILGILLSLPVFLPAALVGHLIYERRLRIAADTLPCPSCGGRLGVEALRASDERWWDQVAEIRRARPRSRIRLVRLVHAICPACGAQYRYEARTETFTPRPATA